MEKGIVDVLIVLVVVFGGGLIGKAVWEIAIARERMRVWGAWSATLQAAPKPLLDGVLWASTRWRAEMKERGMPIE